MLVPTKGGTKFSGEMPSSVTRVSSARAAGMFCIRRRDDSPMPKGSFTMSSPS